jgi:hypothetical protein
MIRNLLLATATLLGLSACAVFPQSPQAVLSSEHRSEVYCYKEEQSLVIVRVRNYLERCYRPIPIARWKVDEQGGQGVTLVSLESQHGFLLVARVEGASASCKSAMQVFVTNQFWMPVPGHINLASLGGDAPCRW